jgi:MATE family multidrug resistance protein
MGLVTATAPMVAIELGRNRHAVREVRRTVRQGLWSAVVIALPIWAILWHAEAILLALGQEPDLARTAAHYLHTLQWSVMPFLGYITLRSFMSAVERPLAALWVAAVAVLFNALAVWTLMFGKFGFPALGLPGAGIGTTLSSTFLFVGLCVMVSLDRRFRRYHIFGDFWRPDWARFREMWRLGLPIAATLVFEVTVFNAAVFLMGLIGADSLAAHSIAIQIASLAFMVPLGLGMAASVRVGRAFGAGDRDGVTRAGWSAYGLAILYACCTAALMLLAPRLLIGVFLDLNAPENQPVIRLAVVFLAFAGLFQIFDATQAAASGMLRGLTDTRIPMIMAGLGYWCIGFPLAIALGFFAGFGGAGIWAGLATGLAAVAIPMTLRWTMRDRLRLHPDSPAADSAAAVIHPL